MMRFGVRPLLAVISAIILMAMLPTIALADGRVTSNDTPYKAYAWRMIRYDDYAVICTFEIDQPGLPALDAVRQRCGDAIAQSWFATPPCPSGNDCTGVYLICTGTYERVQHDFISLDISIDVTVQTNQLIIYADDPLEGADVIRVEGRLDNHPYVCDDPDEIPCHVTLYDTDPHGVPLTVVATSSNGDTREQSGYIRVRAGSVRIINDDGWSGGSDDPAGLMWGAFPPVPVPAWLDHPADLTTERDYGYLAGRLIATGLARAQDCPAWGLQQNGYATACGIDSARDTMLDYQNRYNTSIETAALSAGISSALLKRVIAQESQFWPDAAAANGESGLGQLTAAGADTLLMLDADIFQNYCRRRWDDCWLGYHGLESWRQSMLRYSVLEDAEESGGIELLAHTLTANAGQVDAIINAKNGDQRPGALMSYADLWRLTLLSYNAGPGCVANVLETTAEHGLAYDWPALSPLADAICNGAGSGYVNKITQ